MNSGSRPRPWGWWLLAFIVFCGVLFGLWVWSGESNSSTVEEAAAREVPLGQPIRSALDSLSAHTPEEELATALARLWSDLQNPPTDDPSAMQRAWQELKSLAHRADPGEAATILIAELRKGRDTPTGLRFRVGTDGVLASAPTWRTGLLDLLGQTDPWLALPFSREVLAETNQPDEYALALRNLGWVNINRQLDEEIAGAFAAMLHREDWLNNPTVGYLEGFDLAVELGGPEMVRRMGDLIVPRAQSERVDPVTFAAFLALDRMVQRQPDDFLAVLQAAPDWLQDTPNYRAALMSRLDVRQPAQLAALEGYLRNPRVGHTEKTDFLARFPNRSSMQGHRLVTSWEDVRTQRGLDPASVEQLAQWRQDPSFRELHAEMAAAETRLKQSLGR